MSANDTPTGQPILRVDGVTVRFGDVVAVNEVTFALAPGERLALLGPSGCGKSSLLRAIAGLEPLAAGRVFANGDDITRFAPERRPIGLMFQDDVLFGHRDVGDNIGFGLKMQGVAAEAIAQRVDELLHLVGLEGFARRGVATLSGGEAQRVALARALAPAPKVLLLDEPLGSLDRRRRDQLIEELPDLLAATGTAAIHVTHDHDEAFALGDRVGVMVDGSLRQVGPPRQVWTQPVDLAVAEVLGHTNIVESGTGVEIWRADAAVIDPDGALEATVERVHFRGTDSEVHLRRLDGLVLRFVLIDPPEVGQTVRLRLLGDRMIRF